MQKTIISLGSLIVVIALLLVPKNSSPQEAHMVGGYDSSNRWPSLVSVEDKDVERGDHQGIDYVADETTAIRVAEAIWLPIYGNRIYKKRPFTARLKSPGIWIVEGTLKEGYLGGVPYIEIQKSDCKILKVTHGK